MTRQRSVKVWGQDVPVEVFQRSKSVWVAVGRYMNQHIETKDRTPGAAMKRWAEAARSRGG